jgi:hypothetical protein
VSVREEAMEDLSFERLIEPLLPEASSMALDLSGDICAVMLRSDKADSLAFAADCLMQRPTQTERAMIVMMIQIRMLLPLDRIMLRMEFLIVNISTSCMISIQKDTAGTCSHDELFMLS